MLPIHALSIRTCATMFPPSSATAMFMGWPISVAFFSAALIMRRASSNFTAVIDPPLEVVSRLSVPSFRGGLFDQVCDFFRMRKHWHVAGGDSDRCSLHYRRFGFLKIERDSAIVACDHAPRWLDLPRRGRDCGSENSSCRGSLCRRQQLLLFVWQVLREVLSDSLWGNRQKTFSIRPDVAAERRGWKRLGDRSHGLTLRRRERSDINQSDHLWIVSRLGDHHSPVGMAHQQYRSILQCDGAAGGGNVVGQRGQWILYSDHMQSLGLEQWNYFGPA